MGKKSPAANCEPIPAAKPSKWVWFFLLFVHWVIGAALVVIFSLPYPQAHAAARWLSPNHRMASFTEAVFHNLQPWAWALGGVLLALGLYQLVRPRQTKRWMASIAARLGEHFRRLPGEFRRLWQERSP